MVASGVSLWFCDFAGTGKDTFDALAAHLTPSEAERVNRLVRAESRHQKLVSRALAQVALGSFLDCAVQASDILYPQGQAAAIRAGVSARPVKISISHSGTGVMVALAATERLGLDLQQKSAHRNWSAIAGTWFSGPEKAQLEAASPQQAADQFHRLWCLKEAFAKAMALDLSLALDHDLSAAVGAGSVTERSEWYETGGHPSCWVTAWFQGPYAAALATDRPMPLSVTSQAPEAILQTLSGA